MHHLSLDRMTRKAERGSAVIVFTIFSALVILPVIGLAVDGSIVLWQKARLASSADAAAYAAGRSLSVGATVSEAQSAAIATATTYFNANFTPGTLGTSAPPPTVSVPSPSNGLWTISVDATAQVPLYFLRLLGFSTSTLAAHAQVTRRNVNVILVLDRSASLIIYNSGGCSSLISSAQNFVNLFVAGQDNLGLITFQTTANVDFPFGTDFKTRSVPAFPGVTGMSQLIGKLQCTGYTNTVAALHLAYAQLQAINQPGALNVIVFFSDGRPDAVNATFNVKTGIDNRDTVAYPFTYTNNVAASSCSGVPNNQITGELVAMDEFPDATASTLGVLPTTGYNIDSTAPNSNTDGLLPPPVSSSSAPNCSMSGSTAQFNSTNGALWCSGGACNMRNDVEEIPATDSYGFGTNTGYRTLSTSNSGIFPAGAYTANYIRPDTPAGIVTASLNEAFEQVKVIRSDTSLKPVIYSIGLGSYIDTGFMQDVANDPSAPNPSATSPQGQYIYAPSASQLQSAFQQIASQVLRIAQ